MHSARFGDETSAVDSRRAVKAAVDLTDFTDQIPVLGFKAGAGRCEPLALANPQPAFPGRAALPEKF